jgi:hypothetical protein
VTADHTTADQPDGLRPILEQFRKQCVNKGGGVGFEQTIVDLEALLRRHVLTAQIKEVEDAITEYNRLQEYMTEPSQDLKFGNGYLLDRLAVLRDELAGLKGEK